MGRAPMLVNQSGEAGKRFNATVYDGSAGLGFNAASIASRACNCTSVEANRTRTAPTGPFMSNRMPVDAMPRSDNSASTRAIIAASTFTDDLALAICTAGDWQRVNQANQHRHQHGGVLPERVAVHRVATP